MTTDLTPVPDKQAENRNSGQWLPGQSGNPNGRPPKGHSVTETIQSMMDEKPEIKRALGAKIISMAVGGDITAIRTIWAYLDGLPVAKIQSENVDFVIDL